MKPNECVEKSKPYVSGKPLDVFLKEKGLSECIKLDANENPLGCSSYVREVLDKHVIHRYPDGDASELKAMLASGYKLQPGNFIITPGSNHIIELVCRAYLKHGHKTITGKNTFSLYKIATSRNGGELVETPIVAGKFNLKAMASSIDDKTDIAFICNPNNPTGVSHTREEIIEFLDHVPRKTLVVVDEAYVDFCEEYATVIDLIPRYSNLLVMRTFSKIFGLAGLRIGYAAARDNVISDLSRLLIPFSVSQAALVAAKAALQDTEFLERSYRHVYIERKRLETYFKSKDWFCYPSQTNFIYVEIPIPDIQAQLEEKGILIRPLKSFGFSDNAFRVSIGSVEEDGAFIAAIEELLD